MIKFCKDNGLMEVTTVEVFDVQQVVDEVIDAVNRWIGNSEICISDEDYPFFLNTVLEEAKFKTGE